MFRLAGFLLLTSAICGMSRSPDTIYYPDPGTTFHRSSSPYHCSVCDAYDCLKMDDTTCEYYREVNNVLQKDEPSTERINPAMRAEVDDLLLELSVKESMASRQCIPHISSYTNCNKHNICLGCKACDCDRLGRWRCKKLQRCRARTAPAVDHHLLVQLLETLDTSRESVRAKRKRSIYNNKLSSKERKNELAKSFTIPEITAMLSPNNSFYSQEILKNNDNKNIYYVIRDTTTESITPTNISTTKKNESNLDFDDFFPSYYVSNDNNTEVRLTTQKNFAGDLLDLEFYMDANITKADDTKKPNLTDIYETQTVRVTKREIDNVTKIELNKKINNNYKESVQEITDNVLYPLISTINNRRNEIRKLEHLLDNLQNYMGTNIRNETLKINNTLLENDTKSHVTIYKMEILPKLKDDAMKHTTASLDKYASKLQMDIYEVIKDVVEIQENSHYRALPENLNVLIQAMKYFVHVQGKRHVENEFNKFSKNNMNIYTRLTADHSRDFSTSSATNTVRQILNIVDKEMPQSNAFSPLSNGAKKILNRIVDYNYHDNLTHINHIFSPEYNMANDLKDVGIKWYKMTRTIASSSLANRLLTMKLLHLELSKDIGKINDALAFLKFAQTRRVNIIDKDMGEHYVSRIGEDIRIVNDKIQKIINQQNDYIPGRLNHATDGTPKPKTSFIQQVKNFLKKAKKISNIFKKKVRDNPSKYKENDKWQNNLNFSPNRKKRSAISSNSVVRRIKNILPNYLKNKLNKARNSKIAKPKL